MEAVAVGRVFSDITQGVLQHSVNGESKQGMMSPGKKKKKRFKMPLSTRGGTVDPPETIGLPQKKDTKYPSYELESYNSPWSLPVLGGFY